MWLPLQLLPVPSDALPSVPGVGIVNPEWTIVMTPEGYSDVAIDQRPGFEGREYLSGEWAAALSYTGGGNPAGPVWFREVWGYPCWTTNSNFIVLDEIGVDNPPTNGQFIRLVSRISNGDVEVTIHYEMVDSVTGIDQGDVPAGNGPPGGSTTSGRYLLRQTYVVENVSGGPLTDVRFFQFLRGLKCGVSLYDDRPYTGAMAAYRYDNTQKGNSRSFHNLTGEVFSHHDIICMHAMDPPAAFECGYYGILGVDDHVVGKPSAGVHLSVEADALDGTDFFDPPQGRWVSGAMAFDFPDLADGASHELSVLLSIRSESTFEASPPEIEILGLEIDGPEYVIDFTEKTGVAVDGYVIWSSKDLQGNFPDDWTQLVVPRYLNVPVPGASRFRVPIDPGVNPRCFFVIQAVVE
ncbi:hypothetical protein [Luteolibacter marinus]|uniref:hypothetical protein n=1 Tax=Luteolibacter marinus TaxID=2776705 RepID=UPI00186951AB|nr:hypothetical protein [Luteolibacter marinus]